MVSQGPWGCKHGQRGPGLVVQATAWSGVTERLCTAVGGVSHAANPMTHLLVCLPLVHVLLWKGKV